jgi:3-hydroxyisobutyrate dehydrogenase
MRYGFVGLGNLGGHLAASLLIKGFDVTVNDLDRNRAARHLSSGGKWADSPQALGKSVDCLVTCLPSPSASEAIVKQAFAGPHAAVSSWIEMSTLGREEILRLSRLASEHGVRMLECPVTGGVHLAAKSKVTVLIGGDADLFHLHKAALHAIGDKVFYMGPLGSAAVIKVITNMLAFIHLVADGEALMLAKRAGLDLGQAWQAIAASSGTSFVHETEGQLILNGSYDIAFTMDLALKDLGFAMSLGSEFGVPLELAALTHQAFVKGRAAYGGTAQSTQVVKLLEDALKTDLRAPGFPPRLI